MGIYMANQSRNSIRYLHLHLSELALWNRQGLKCQHPHFISDQNEFSFPFAYSLHYCSSPSSSWSANWQIDSLRCEGVASLLDGPTYDWKYESTNLPGPPESDFNYLAENDFLEEQLLGFSFHFIRRQTCKQFRDGGVGAVEDVVVGGWYGSRGGRGGDFVVYAANSISLIKLSPGNSNWRIMECGYCVPVS